MDGGEVIGGLLTVYLERGREGMHAFDKKQTAV